MSINHKFRQIEVYCFSWNQVYISVRNCFRSLMWRRAFLSVFWFSLCVRKSSVLMAWNLEVVTFLFSSRRCMQMNWLCARVRKNSKWIWLGNTTITHCRPTHVTVRKSHRTLTETRHHEDNQSKAISSFFLVNIIAKLERTQSDAYQNKAQTTNPPPPPQKKKKHTKGGT